MERRNDGSDGGEWTTSRRIRMLRNVKKQLHGRNGRRPRDGDWQEIKKFVQDRKREETGSSAEH